MRPDDPRHGTLSAYTHHRCRCERCREAMRVYRLTWQKDSRGQLGPNDPRHGTVNGYNNYGCRCTACRAAVAEKTRARRRAKDLAELI